MDGWFCPDCHSLNRMKSTKCYACGTPQVVALRARLPENELMGQVPAMPADQAPAWEPPPLPPYRTGTLRAALVVVLLAMSVACTIAIVVVSGAASGGILEIGTRMVSPSAFSALLQLAIVRAVLWLVTPIAWFIWFDRVLRNVPAVGAGWPDHGRIGAVGWWFVPIAWWWKPVGAVSEAYRRLAVTRTPGAWLPACWWLAWVGSALVPVIGGVIVGIVAGMSHAPMERLQGAATLLDMSGDALEVAAGLLAVAMVVAMQRAQVDRARPLMADAAAAKAAKKAEKRAATQAATAAKEAEKAAKKAEKDARKSGAPGGATGVAAAAAVAPSAATAWDRAEADAESDHIPMPEWLARNPAPFPTGSQEQPQAPMLAFGPPLPPLAAGSPGPMGPTGASPMGPGPMTPVSSPPPPDQEPRGRRRWSLRRDKVATAPVMAAAPVIATVATPEPTQKRRRRWSLRREKVPAAPVMAAATIAPPRQPSPTSQPGGLRFGEPGSQSDPIFTRVPRVRSGLFGRRRARPIEDSDPLAMGGAHNRRAVTRLGVILISGLVLAGLIWGAALAQGGPAGVPIPTPGPTPLATVAPTAVPTGPSSPVPQPSATPAPTHVSATPEPTPVKTPRHRRAP